jgi:cellulose synthase/poly-beta-1,6-N-acetylglucosamine synthase-like glycosyltransferase
MSILALIPAHNEAAILGETLAGLWGAVPPPDGILVLADHCTDATVSVAEQKGALVFQRETGEGGKGPALRWLFAQRPPLVMQSALVVILDADSRVNPGFFNVIATRLEQGARAAQSFVQPIDTRASVASALAAYSEVLSQLMDERLRAWLGWSVRLRGTGMVFAPHLLAELLERVHTRAEDIELTLLLAHRRERVWFLPQAVVYDPKPPDVTRVSRQRARWLQGQWQVLSAYGSLILRLLGRGPEVWWLLQSTLLKPRTLFLLVTGAILGITFLFPVSPWIRLGFALLIVADLAYYGAGLFLIPQPERRHYAWAMLRAPLYGVMWAASLITAWRTPHRWLSVRHDDRP